MAEAKRQRSRGRDHVESFSVNKARGREMSVGDGGEL